MLLRPPAPPRFVSMSNTSAGSSRRRCVYMCAEALMCKSDTLTTCDAHHLCKQRYKGVPVFHGMAL